MIIGIRDVRGTGPLGSGLLGRLKDLGTGIKFLSLTAYQIE